MTTLNEASAVRMGTTVVSRVYAGPTQAWPVLPTGYAGVVLGTPGLVGYWRLGEAAGSSVAADAKGTNPGTYVGSPTLGIAGAIAGNTAMRPIPSGYVSVPDSASLDTGNVFTYEAWVWRDVAATYQGLFGKGRNSAGLYIQPSGILRCDKHQVAHVRDSSVIVPTGGWHHIVFTKNGAAALWYIDGADASGSGTGSAVIDNTAFALFIGATNDAGLLHGELNPLTEPAPLGNIGLYGIDEAAVYNVALTPGQVLAHYNARTA